MLIMFIHTKTCLKKLSSRRLYDSISRLYDSMNPAGDCMNPVGD